MKTHTIILRVTVSDHELECLYAQMMGEKKITNRKASLKSMRTHLDAALEGVLEEVVGTAEAVDEGTLGIG
jgi:hypothetical protein